MSAVQCSGTLQWVHHSASVAFSLAWPPLRPRHLRLAVRPPLLHTLTPSHPHSLTHPPATCLPDLPTRMTPTPTPLTLCRMRSREWRAGACPSGQWVDGVGWDGMGQPRTGRGDSEALPTLERTHWSPSGLDESASLSLSRQQHIYGIICMYHAPPPSRRSLRCAKHRRTPCSRSPVQPRPARLEERSGVTTRFRTEVELPTPSRAVLVSVLCMTAWGGMSSRPRSSSSSHDRKLPCLGSVLEGEGWCVGEEAKRRSLAHPLARLRACFALSYDSVRSV